MPFYEGRDLTNFIISFRASPRHDFGALGRGYALAAQRLANHLLAAQHFRDYEAYPVVFLYRHALELYLKHVIYSSARIAAFLSVDSINASLHNTHNLTHLAGIVERLLPRCFPRDPTLQNVIEGLVSTCRDFAEIDQRSDGYRYPIDSKGQASTKPKQRISLRALASHMNRLLDDLDALDLGLNVQCDNAQEVYEILQSIAEPSVDSDEQ